MSQVVALLLAYNQEKFVRDAVRDVLSQDMDDLKVILSDDFSTDHTFEILMEEGSRYQGKKHLIIRRNSHNLGMNEHINLLVSMSREEVIIPFAGDDRFDPSRARLLSQAIVEKKVLLVHSGYECIDEQGLVTNKHHESATFYSDTSPKSAATSGALYVGATAAWHRSIFEKYGRLPPSKAYEDLILGFRASLEDAVAYIPEKLVNYRVGVGRSYIESSYPTASTDLLREKYDFERSSDLFAARLKDYEAFSQTIDPTIKNDLQLAYAANHLKADLLGRILNSQNNLIHTIEVRENELSQRDAAFAHRMRALELYQRYLQKVLKPNLTQRIFFHKRGTPRYAVKRMMFSKTGRIRSWARSLVVDTQGRPRTVFYCYLISAEYLKLKNAHRVPWLRQ